ncbi:MAG: OmpH family outer membrane protein [Sphingobacteriia bacterium]|nr:OmpH family outer membrane protein [Sphingobacteriia bacterium]
MKKVAVALAVIISVASFSNVNAQVKIGLFDREAVLSLMPGIQKIDTLLQKYVNDSLKTEYDYTYSEFLAKDSALKKDSVELSKKPALKEIREKAVNELKIKLVNWQQYQNQLLQKKQNDLLQPYLEKMYAAMQEVIAEHKYTHIFKPDVFEYFDMAQAQEFNLRVLDKMRIPLPKEVEDQIKALKGGIKPAATGAPVNKPAVKH